MLPKNVTILYENFWKEAPFFLFGISFLIGLAAAFSHSFIPYFLLIILYFPLRNVSYFLLSLFFTLAGHIYSIQMVPQEFSTKDPISGIGYFSITSISPSTSFTPRLTYKGTLISFVSDDKKTQITHIPCTIYVHNTESRPKGTHEYLIKGKLLPIQAHQTLFKVHKNDWYPQKKVRSLVELRWEAKNFCRQFLKDHIFHRRTADFLSALVTGDLDENFIKFSFARLGLQHIMAISGFHFSVVVASFSLLLRFFVSYRMLSWILLGLVQLYFLFLGVTPSIERSWISIQLALLGKILNLRNFPINALGAGLIIELIIDPLHALHIGFQLSFLSTACILLGYSFVDKHLDSFGKKRKTSEIRQLHPISQMGNTCLFFLRESIALSLAVNAAVIPVVLFYFHKFPLLGFIHNLFFPALVGIAMFLFILTVFCHLLFPPLSVLFDYVTTYFTKWALDFVSYPPIALDCYIRVPPFSFFYLIFYLALLFTLYIYFQKDKKTEIFDTL